MNFIYLEEIDSTNRWAKDNIDDIEDMSVVYTYNQTSGRGRLNRKWNYMGSDNIYASIIIKPKIIINIPNSFIKTQLSYLLQ